MGPTSAPCGAAGPPASPRGAVGPAAVPHMTLQAPAHLRTRTPPSTHAHSLHTQPPGDLLLWCEGITTT